MNKRYDRRTAKRQASRLVTEQMDMLVVMRVSDTKPGGVVAGAIIKFCSRCDQKVYVSPSSFELSKTTPIVCARCLKLSEVQQMDMHLLPATLAEVQQH
jgi:hypothetical protein